MKNIDKILSYISKFTFDPIYVDGQLYPCPEITQVKLADTFFLKDNCYGCGCCCVPEDNIYTAREYAQILNITDKELVNYALDPIWMHELRDGLHSFTVNINGEDVMLYQYDLVSNTMYLPNKGKEVPRCAQLFFDYDMKIYRCKIHPIRSLTCRMPHMRIFHNKKSGNVSIGTSQFGRNWAVGCKVEFESPDKYTFEQIKDQKLSLLNYAYETACDFGIRTFIPKIIKYVQDIPYDNYHEYLNRPVVTQTNSKRLF